MSKPVYTAEERTRREREAKLIAELLANRKSRPEARVETRLVEEEMEHGQTVEVERDVLVCPYCGEYDEFQYVETIGNSREVRGIDPSTGELDIDGFYETEGFDESGEDERLYCRGCDDECNLPAGLSINWL